MYPPASASWNTGQQYPAWTGGKPRTYLPLSIIALLFSFVFGAIGLYFSCQVTPRWDVGNIIGAKTASNTALIIDIIGIAFGAIVLFVVILPGLTPAP
jgi:hypothetical protein